MSFQAWLPMPNSRVSFVSFLELVRQRFLPTQFRIQGPCISKNEFPKIRPATFDNVIWMERVDGCRAFDRHFFKVRALVNKHGPQYEDDWFII